MIISAAILLLILTPIFLSMILSLPIAQNKIVSLATEFATEYLQTEVSIARIDVTMSGRFEIKGFLVRDLDGDTLLYTKHVNSRLLGYSRSANRLTLGGSTIKGAMLNLRQTTRGEMNIREISKRLISKRLDEGGRLSIVITDVDLSQMRLHIEQLTHLNPTYGMDVRNIRLNNLEGEVRDLLIDGSSVHAHVDRVSAQEHSGLQLQSLSGELYLTSGALCVSDMNITTQWSSLTLPYFMLTSSKWADYKEFNTNTDISLRVSDGYISSDDIAYFSPSMVNYGVVLYDLDLSISGEVENMMADVANVSYGDATRVSARATLTGLPSLDRLRSKVNIRGISTCAEDILMLDASISSAELPQSVARMISDAGQITMRGEVRGLNGLNTLHIKSTTETELGEISTDIEIENRGRELTGNFTAKRLNIGKILQNRALGRVTFSTDIAGVVVGERDFTTRSNIERVDLFGDRLQNISIETKMQGSDISGGVVVADSKLRLAMQLDAMNLDKSRSELIPSYDITLDIEHADLKALGINRRDTTSTISANISASIIGRDVESAYAEVELAEAEYRYNSERISTGEASLLMRSAEQDRLVELRSRFFDIDFHSASSVAQITSYLKGVMRDYLPSLYNTPLVVASNVSGSAAAAEAEQDEDEDEDEQDGEQQEQQMAYSSSSTSMLSIITHDINPIAKAVMEDLELADGSSVLFTFNEDENLFDFKFNSDFIERKALLAIGVSTHLTNQSDSLTLKSRFNELYVGMSRMRGAEILAGAKSDEISLESRFINPTDSISADIKASLQLSRNAAGRSVLNAELLPSIVVQRDRTWALDARKVYLSERGIGIDNFVAESRNQRLNISGYASRSQRDTLKMEMQDFDLSILSSLIARVGYQIDGRTNGLLVASSALDNAKLRAHIALDSVSVNTIAAPAMEMDVTWDSQLNRARLILENRATRDTLVRGYYIPSQVKYYARCEVDSLNMGLLDPPLGGVIKDTKGYARLNLTLQGQRRDAKLSGDIHITELESTVDYTGVRYRMPSAIVKVSNNRLQSSGVIVEDMVGGDGLLDIDVNLQHLSNIGYSLRILPQKMMVLNTTEQDNELFYGEVYASGLAQISGDKSGVRMNITASSEGASHFYMPLSNKESASVADFITFVRPTVTDTLDLMASRRRTFERKAQGNSGNMLINMSLDINPNTEVQLVIDPTVGDIIKARGEGQLNLSLEPKANRFEIYGDYTIEEGSYLFTLQNIVNKRFVIDPGSSIQWAGSPTDARLNINAIYKLKASLQPLISDESSRAIPVDCIITLTEMLTQPEVSFSIDLPSSDGETQAMFNNLVNDQEAISRQFFYLMLANSFIAESSGGTADLGASAGAATGFELLTNQLSNWLSTSNYNVIIRYRPESELTGDELDVGFSKGLINNRLLVELEGNYVTDNTTTTTSENVSNFMGEAYITWLIDHAGALRLKGFTQTIDRFDENQGLQETGMGVYYRESFNNFADLRERVHARFSRSPEGVERQAQRRRRRSERRAEHEAMLEEKRRLKAERKAK